MVLQSRKQKVPVALEQRCVCDPPLKLTAMPVFGSLRR
jgi:hypothetical protein